MKKILAVAVLIIVSVGLYILNPEAKIAVDAVKGYVTTPSHINKEGATVQDRLKPLESYTLVSSSAGSFSTYIKTRALKQATAQVINYDDKPYAYQAGHIGVLDIDVPSNGLQQCADALIRLRAEYLWESNRKDKIGFEFTSGHYCSWTKYAAGYRPKINGNKVSFHKTATANSSKAGFYNYLNLIYTYAGTISLGAEMKKITSKQDLQVGDMLLYSGSPGHVIMIASIIENETGDRKFAFLQGNTPAQSIHMLKNLEDTSISPWYDVTIGESLSIPTYAFAKAEFVRFK